MVKYKITLTDSPDPADVDVVREGLNAHDATRSHPVFYVQTPPIKNEAINPELNTWQFLSVHMETRQ
jgi:hypothetical protein